MLARPLPYSIRIDTFEIWRSERIYPDGVNLYQSSSVRSQMAHFLEGYAS